MHSEIALQINRHKGAEEEGYSRKGGKNVLQ
jgi:hypothetical protein